MAVTDTTVRFGLSGMNTSNSGLSPPSVHHAENSTEPSSFSVRFETICWSGVREAFDDIRYATVLKTLATPLLQDGDETVRREARRALVWLENQDGDTASLVSVRRGIIDRILTLRRLLKAAGREV